MIVLYDLKFVPLHVIACRKLPVMVSAFEKVGAEKTQRRGGALVIISYPWLSRRIQVDHVAFLKGCSGVHDKHGLRVGEAADVARTGRIPRQDP